MITQKCIINFLYYVKIQMPPYIKSKMNIKHSFPSLFYCCKTLKSVLTDITRDTTHLSFTLIEAEIVIFLTSLLN